MHLALGAEKLFCICCNEFLIRGGRTLYYSEVGEVMSFA